VGKYEGGAMSELQQLFQRRAQLTQLLNYAFHVSGNFQEQEMCKAKIEEVNQRIKLSRMMDETENKDQMVLQT
jgi:hypothetical protein